MENRIQRLLIALVTVLLIAAFSACEWLVFKAIKQGIDAVLGLLSPNVRVALYGVAIVAISAIPGGFLYMRERISRTAVYLLPASVGISYVGFVIFAGWQLYDWRVGLGIWVPSLLFAATLGMQRRHYQRRGERAAKQIRVDVRRGIHRDFALYLRPFASTNAMNIYPAEVNMQPVEPLDFETTIEREFPASLPLETLGLPGEMRGAFRIFSSKSDWWQDFKLLARVAALILILPSAREGTAREIGWICQNNLIGKCLWLMPPLPETNNGFDVQQEWENAQARLASIGINLPAYNPGGWIFQFRDGAAHAASLRETILAVHRVDDRGRAPENE